MQISEHFFQDKPGATACRILVVIFVVTRRDFAHAWILLIPFILKFDLLPLFRLLGQAKATSVTTKTRTKILDGFLKNAPKFA